MTAMKVMMDKQTKLIVPCIESLGLTTGAEKKDKAMVPPHLNFNISLKHGDSIKLDLTLSAPIFITSFGIIRSIDKIKEFKENVTNFLQCIMKCVFVKGKMVKQAFHERHYITILFQTCKKHSFIKARA